MQELSAWNLVLAPTYFLIIIFIARFYSKKKAEKEPVYNYFIKGLLAKLIGCFFFCIVYSFYYEGGDTGAYFENSRCVANLFSKNFSVAFSIFTNHLTMENHHYFDQVTGMPHWYMYKDETTFATARFTIPFTFLGLKTFIPTSFLVATVSYIGIWKLFKLFVELYPKYTKLLSYSILFIPSFVFWGSGIMKDTFIVGATCWATYNFHKIFIKRDKLFTNALLFFLNFWVIITLKPYVVSALLVGMLFWLNSAYLNKIKNQFLRYMTLPFILVIVFGTGLYVFKNISSLLGDYGDFESAIERAQVTQQDLLREEQYGSNNYNLGKIDQSVSGLLKKAPMAIFTAIYRPSVIEIGSVSVLMSVIENTFLLLVSVYILLKTKTRRLFNIIRSNPLILYSMTFSLVLAFGVGIASANFGAMVRYKIPLIPFFFSALFLIYKLSREEK